MTDFKLTLRIVLGSFCLATFLGYMDYETQSLYHLFTAESGGNFLALLLYTAIFTILVWFFIAVGRFEPKRNQQKK